MMTREQRIAAIARRLAGGSSTQEVAAQFVDAIEEIVDERLSARFASMAGHDLAMRREELEEDEGVAIDEPPVGTTRNPDAPETAA